MITLSEKQEECIAEFLLQAGIELDSDAASAILAATLRSFRDPEYVLSIAGNDALSWIATIFDFGRRYETAAREGAEK